MLLLTWILTIIALIFALGHLVFAMLERISMRVSYLHYRTRMPVLCSILIFTGGVLIVSGDMRHVIPLLIQAFALAFSFFTHQERILPAEMKMEVEKDIQNSLLREDALVVVVEIGDTVRAYPNTYAAHHHLLNDKIGDQRILVSYCPMCNTIIVYDTTDYGLFKVSGFKNGNMLMGDLQTYSYWQQATGTAHFGAQKGKTLTPIMSSIMSWEEAKADYPNLEVVKVDEAELEAFELPIPNLWGKLLRSEFVPGLEQKSMDSRYLPRTKIIGVAHEKGNFAYLKDDILAHAWQQSDDLHLLLVASGDSVQCFSTLVNGQALKLSYDSTKRMIVDETSGTYWASSGKYQHGTIMQDLRRVRVSDEFWYSWAYFHPFTQVIKTEALNPSPA